jgi:hypothetical protein
MGHRYVVRTKFLDNTVNFLILVAHGPFSHWQEAVLLWYSVCLTELLCIFLYWTMVIGVGHQVVTLFCYCGHNNFVHMNCSCSYSCLGVFTFDQSSVFLS